MSTKQGDTALLNEWVSIIDFEKRFPSAIEAAMAG